MKVELELVLARPAKRFGGDRYESGTKGMPTHVVIYLPQTFSRPKGSPLPKLRMTIVGDTEE